LPFVGGGERSQTPIISAPHWKNRKTSGHASLLGMSRVEQAPKRPFALQSIRDDPRSNPKKKRDG
jgi:hypothetical protein